MKVEQIRRYVLEGAKLNNGENGVYGPTVTWAELVEFVDALRDKIDGEARLSLNTDQLGRGPLVHFVTHEQVEL